jgi:phosphatidylinositol alpha-1,6-mannosyltransferase
MTDALLVSSSFLPGAGGIESYLGELCDALAPRLAVLAAGERDGEPLRGDLGYRVHPFDGRLLAPGPKAVAAIERAAAAEDTDRVLFGTPWPLALLGPRLENRDLRYAVIIHGAEMTVPAAVPVLRQRFASALAGAELLLPVSEFTASKVRGLLASTGHEAPPIELLRARVDLERFTPEAAPGTTKAAAGGRDAGGTTGNETEGSTAAEARGRLGLGEETPVILCFGRLVARKGVHRLIEALPGIRSRVPGATLVVAGTGPEEVRLRRLAARGGLLGPAVDGDGGPGKAGPGEETGPAGQSGPGVIFAGRVPDEAAPGVYAMADVFALPVVDRWFGLEFEGLGVVLLEAAACGTPCVTGISGGTPEAVIDGVTGYVIDARDSHLLTDRVVRLLLDSELAAEMGRAGRAHVKRHFANRELPAGLIEWMS